MNGVDIAFAVVILLFGVWGWIKGFVRFQAKALGVALGLVLAVQLYQPVGKAVAGSLNLPDTVGYFVAGAGVFLLVYVVFMFVGKLIRKLLETVELSWLDKTFGFLLGVFIGILAVGFITMFAFKFGAFGLENTMADSSVAEMSTRVSAFFISYLPSGYSFDWDSITSITKK